MSASKAIIRIWSIEITDPFASPRSFKLIGDLSLGNLDATHLTTYMNSEESTAMNALLDKVVERIKSNLRQGL